MRKAIGFIVNPIAGMGGKVALKGTDGSEVLSRAIALGAVPEAEQKAKKALQELCDLPEKPVILTASGAMGENICKELQLRHLVVERCGAVTTEQDTISAARQIQLSGAELLIFAGGDGTARNVCAAIGESMPVIGIPAGVKIQSAVFALSPAHAGRLAANIISGHPYQLRPQEVIDLNEDAYRSGKVSSTLYGYMSIPVINGYLQNMKQSGFSTDREQLNDIAEFLVRHMEREYVYAIGSGSTAKCIMRQLKLPYELLGIDLIQDHRLIANDVTEEQLFKIASAGKLRIIVSPIGGQGFLFGRGNHQFSERVLEKVGRDGISVMATAQKLISISGGQLRIDCGEEEVNRQLSGYYQVIAGYGYHIVMPCNREMISTAQ
ncbi:ATP-NAD kinase family protein [Oscillibacter sp. MSJ-2]|uniref:ATP-NAD kinase family protein n=1 Tax=Dysosmobacter acutus TaxID=2841504 RepID=A0ABS6F797_9FIRM|nr:ATP-NAD kinase family protein [Dysosmobacter acutus]MBU5626132.1 ATP-NAD kinase family protein [Dysosmobacter acutus]